LATTYLDFPRANLMPNNRSRHNSAYNLSRRDKADEISETIG